MTCYTTSLFILLINVCIGVIWCPNYSYALSTNQNINSDVTVCNADRLAVYKVVLQTYWTRELFPKHYPDWRPPAQWTKTFGENKCEFFFFFFYLYTPSFLFRIDSDNIFCVFVFLK